ncbi:MAG: [Fe-Fe] hydrogenase large subunit C-terminal domain-containing protein [Pseudoflavonifractor sp.]
MTDYIGLKKSNCKNCYKCIRNCPVKSIRFADHQANIVPEECILCGRCFNACPQNAKVLRDDVPRAKALLETGAPVYVSLAPSFVASYDGATIGTMTKALKQLGFTAVEETAIGATIVKTEYEAILRGGSQNVVISSCCHSVNLLIQKHFPEVLPCLAKVLSPMQAHCKDMKRRCPEARCVFIGPCIAKKDEAEAYPGIVDCALTFEELDLWFQGEGIALEPVPDQNPESRARLFPITGGILRSMAERHPDYAYLAVDGIENCISALGDIADGKLGKCFIEMSACPGSCVGGPAMGKNRRAAVRDYLAVDRYAGDRDFPVVQPAPERLKKAFPLLAPHIVQPGTAAIEGVLRRMGKNRPADELNCGSCGYDTCRDKAAAVLLGKADIGMCLPYLKEKAESFSDQVLKNAPNAILVASGGLEIQQVNEVLCRLMNLPDSAGLIGSQVEAVLDPQSFYDARERGRAAVNPTLYLPEYQKYVEQSVSYDAQGDIFLCVMRDKTEEVRRHAEREAVSRTTIEITDKVIEKQMRTVQEIASLLGETTAETKVALTKLKESLGHE